MTTAWVGQPVEECGGDDVIAEDRAPFGEAAEGGEDLVTDVDELEEQIAAAGVDDRRAPRRGGVKSD